MKREINQLDNQIMFYVMLLTIDQNICSKQFLLKTDWRLFWMKEKTKHRHESSDKS